MSSTTTWMRSAKPHPNGDTKTCHYCGHTIHRTTKINNTTWHYRRYCDKTCAGRAASKQPTTAQQDEINALGEQVRQAAACKGHRADFVPDSKIDARPAIAVCADCPVRAQCLTYGLATKSTGVWGGEWLDPWKTPRTT